MSLRKAPAKGTSGKTQTLGRAKASTPQRGATWEESAFADRPIRRHQPAQPHPTNPFPKIDEVESTSIPLRSYWFHRHKPSIQFGTGCVELRLPHYFRQRTWTVPLDQVGVLDLNQHDSPAETVTEPGGILFASVHLVPYFVTTAPATNPNLLLVFRSKQRVPPFRRCFYDRGAPTIPFSARMTRSAEGAWVSGLSLRAEDPALANSTMVSNGIATVTSMLQWMTDHYETINDQSKKEQHVEMNSYARRIGFVGVALLVVALGGSWLFIQNGNPSVSVVLFALAGLLFLVNRPICEFLIRRRSRRQSHR